MSANCGIENRSMTLKVGLPHAVLYGHPGIIEVKCPPLVTGTCVSRRVRYTQVFARRCTRGSLRAVRHRKFKTMHDTLNSTDPWNRRNGELNDDISDVSQSDWRRVGSRRERQDASNLNPADHSDVVGAFPASDAEDVDAAVAAAKKAYASWRLVPAPKRAEILTRDRDPAAGAQGEVCPRHDARNGQGAGRDAGRCAGGDRRSLLCGRRRPSPLWRHNAVGAGEQVRHERAHAGRSRRADYALELSDGDSQLEAVSGPGCRQYLRHQAGGRIRRSRSTTWCRR